ncbi:uncharacterized protein LOC131027973 isoform X2 [Cryptomeria japonica]|uniref:uncharacterized protein LOC131027973 isoform X2 n=1 Tax=Cryptomeria japonica TaxID=3369 RepID=UPI0027DA5218|nr:uncharacterized protein LOC131027973 isoform X2 [Cryptomeria japonica]
MKMCHSMDMNRPSFCAYHQFKTIVALKQTPKPAFRNRLQFSMWCRALDTSCPSVSYKYVNGGSRRRSNITQFTAAHNWTDEVLMDDDDDDYEESSEMEDPPKAEVGDGEEGGGASLGGTAWGGKALAIAEEVIGLFKDDLEIFAFKALNRGRVCVRLDKLSNKYGSPSIDEIEKFSNIYSEHLDKAKESGDLPHNLVLEVSTPGAERVVRVPKDLIRFKDLPMYVKYKVETTISENGSQEQDIYLMEAAIEDDGSEEHDGIFVLDNVEMELGYCTWKLANVRLNRELLGKGRTLNKKKREWRLRVPFTSLVLVRLYLDL